MTIDAEVFDAQIAAFDQENGLWEEVLKDVFAQKPLKSVKRDVHLKVLTLNTLYSTHLYLYSPHYLTVEDVASHIVANGEALDKALSSGDVGAIDLITPVNKNGKSWNCFVFATKYCSWSAQTKFPIYDSRVLKYLLKLFMEDGFVEAGKLRGDLWTYEMFRSVLDAFRDKVGKSKRSYKDSDNFLYMMGRELFEPSADGPLDSSHRDEAQECCLCGQARPC